MSLSSCPGHNSSGSQEKPICVSVLGNGDKELGWLWGAELGEMLCAWLRSPRREAGTVVQLTLQLRLSDLYPVLKQCLWIPVLQRLSDALKEEVPTL